MRLLRAWLAHESPERKRRVGLLLIVLVATVFYFTLVPSVPRTQHLRFLLGDSAPRVTELEIRYVSVRDEEIPARDATFHFGSGAAPRVVGHEPTLSDGDYVVEIEVTLEDAGRSRSTRRVNLRGGSVTVDLSQTARHDEAR